MTRSVHTPGPWQNKREFILASDPNGKHPGIYIAAITTVNEQGRVASAEQQRANARIIATAPELLAAAQLVIERWSNGALADAVRQLDAAVMAATVEG